MYLAGCKHINRPHYLFLSAALPGNKWSGT